VDISKWNKAMESFQELLGWKKSILDIENKDERRLMHRLRRAYDRAKQYKESI
jgi:hypothetical protein